MATPTSGPGLLYVNSRITSSRLSPELFTKWYQDIHIRDIFETSGINAAFRYFTRSAEPANVDRPYLALYPLQDLAFLTSAEFRAIPVVSEMLPEGSKDVFDVADFDTRYYIGVGDNREPEVETTDPDNYLTSIQFDLPNELKVAKDAEIVEWYQSQNSGNPAAAIRLYRLHFQRQNRLPPEQSTLPKPPRMLALHEFANEADAQKFASSNDVSRHSAPFKLLRAFHKTKKQQ